MPSNPPLSPSWVCDDVDKTYDYFTQVLGFAGQGKMPGPDGRTLHTEVFLATRYGEARILLGPRPQGPTNEFTENLPRGPFGNGVMTYLRHPDVDKYHAFLQQRGAQVTQPPADQFWGDRTLEVRTPEGYFLTFAQPIKGFKWPKEALASITDARTAAAPGAKKTPARRTATARKARK